MDRADEFHVYICPSYCYRDPNDVECTYGKQIQLIEGHIITRILQ